MTHLVAFFTPDLSCWTVCTWVSRLLATSPALDSGVFLILLRTLIWWTLLDPMRCCLRFLRIIPFSTCLFESRLGIGCWLASTHHRLLWVDLLFLADLNTCLLQRKFVVQLKSFWQPCVSNADDQLVEDFVFSPLAETAVFRECVETRDKRFCWLRVVLVPSAEPADLEDDVSSRDEVLVKFSLNGGIGLLLLRQQAKLSQDWARFGSHCVDESSYLDWFALFAETGSLSVELESVNPVGPLGFVLEVEVGGWLEKSFSHSWLLSPCDVLIRRVLKALVLWHWTLTLRDTRMT